MKIGSLSLDNFTILAPLAGITNLPFRLIAKKEGCALVSSEMISANGLVYRSEKTMRLLDSFSDENPFSVQIFGTNPLIMGEAALIAEASGANVIDINFGCSVKKIIKTGAGAALMKDTKQAADVIKAVRKAVSVPVTIKIRTGWDSSGSQALKIAKIAEDCGADAITVHPRTALQGFSGNANWSIISAVKKHVLIPVIGNGDICTAEDAMQMQKQTGCDAVMIGRAAIGNPWIFSQILAYDSGKQVQFVGIDERFKVIFKYLRLSVDYFGEKHACYMMRSRLSWFVKGLPYSSNFRNSMRFVLSEKEVVELITDYMNRLQNDVYI